MSLAKPSRDRRTLLGVVTSTFLDQVEREDFDKFILRFTGALFKGAAQFPCRTAPGARCRRKIEMSPGVQSRDDTPVGDGHEEGDLDCIPAGG